MLMSSMKNIFLKLLRLFHFRKRKSYAVPFKVVGTYNILDKKVFEKTTSL